MSKPTIAIIGSGISGIATAWLLQKQYQVTIFERNNYLGGHTNTIEVKAGQQVIPVDTGFIVYNQANYPHLTAFFNWLDVRTQPTDMSFSVSVNNGELEYAGSNLNTLFCQRRQLISSKFWQLLADIIRFNHLAKKFLASNPSADVTMKSFLQDNKFNPFFNLNYLLPMAAAIWSCPINKMLQFPATSLLRFFYNHGLLNITDRPQWHSVCNGSYHYIKAFLARFNGTWKLSQPIKTVIRHKNYTTVITTSNQQQQFDQVIFACHANQALQLLDKPSPQEASILNAFNYQKNIAVLHSDNRLMPTNRRAWSAWNYQRTQQNSQVSVTYWINLLQRLTTEQQFFVTLNPVVEPIPKKTIKIIEYQHPVFNTAAIQAQQELASIQGQKRSWFCGSYTGYGFHEDGFKSALSVANLLNCEAPWQQMN
ncbi:NAD(P)/FAD-dependent oxidoreductase [Spartinivicinus ruber]|uniref:NAD(P)/FAD-dependent oxidoreductase n=1 Tax=Spartinivicinus ruber TaxID=2683272 RepID=UPI0013D0700F|nr:FAD-dependent oxidoreductase [Spartinivicinus ruber]